MEATRDDDAITRKVIEHAIEVHSERGPGLLERPILSRSR